MNISMQIEFPVQRVLQMKLWRDNGDRQRVKERQHALMDATYINPNRDDLMAIDWSIQKTIKWMI